MNAKDLLGCIQIIACILALIIALILAIRCIDISITSNHEHQENIYSLSNPTGDSNNFVLGLGSEGFDTYYYFYTEEKGSYILNQVKVDGSEIHFVDTDSSCAVITTYNGIITGGEKIKESTAELYFPKDTVLQKTESIAE